MAERFYLYTINQREILSSTYLSNDSSLKLSFDDKSVGSCIIDSLELNVDNICPMNSTKTIDPLQYDGSIHFLEINKSTLRRGFSSLFLTNGEEALNSARLLIDGFIEASDSDSGLMEPEIIVNSLFKIS